MTEDARRKKKETLWFYLNHRMDEMVKTAVEKKKEKQKEGGNLLLELSTQLVFPVSS